MASPALRVPSPPAKVVSSTDRRDRPLGAYVETMALFSAVMAGLLLTARRRGKRLPENLSGIDLAILGIATHWTSRTIARDRVTSPLRAPFTQYEKRDSKLAEKPAGNGIRQSIGQLMICPYCLSPWIGTAFLTGLLQYPNETRLVAAALTIATVSDVLHELT